MIYVLRQARLSFALNHHEQIILSSPRDVPARANALDRIGLRIDELERSKRAEAHSRVETFWSLGTAIKIDEDIANEITPIGEAVL